MSDNNFLKSAWQKTLLRDCALVQPETVIATVLVAAKMDIQIMYLILIYLFSQMNQVIARNKSGSDNNSSFELERSNRETTKNPEESRILIKCKDEETRDNWIKIINDQVYLLQNIGDMLTNPTSLGVNASWYIAQNLIPFMYSQVSIKRAGCIKRTGWNIFEK